MTTMAGAEGTAEETGTVETGVAAETGAATTADRIRQRRRGGSAPHWPRS
jgi:hypothetical protein